MFKVWILKQLILLNIVFLKCLLNGQGYSATIVDPLFPLYFLFDVQLASYLISSRKHRRKHKHGILILELRT